MRDDEFKQKLSEVSEWEIPLTLESTEQGREKRRKSLEQAGLDCYNPTFPPKLRRLKHQPKACEDCGKIVEGRQVDIQIYKNKKTCGRKEKCLACGLHKDPYTGKFCLTGTEASVKWSTYARPVERRYKEKIEVKPQRETVWETDREIITKSQ